MKQVKLLLLSCLILSFLSVNAQKPATSKGHDIKFQVNKYAGNKALIAYHFGDKQYILDTLDRNANGVFEMKADTLLPGGIYLFVMPPKNIYFEFLVDSKDGQQFSLETDTLDFVKNMKVKGSAQNDLFFGDVRFISEKRKQADKLQEDIKIAGSDSVKIKKLQAELKALDKEVIAQRQKIVENNPNMLYSAMLKGTKEPEIPETPKKADGSPVDSAFAYKYYKGHYWDLISFGDDRLLRTPILQGKLNQYLDRVCSPNPDSLSKEALTLIKKSENGGSYEMFKYMVVTLLNKYANSKRMGDDAVYVAIAENYYCTNKALRWTDSAQVKKICDRALSLSSTIIGRPAPEVRIMDEYDKWQSLYDVKADYTVLYFWDYNCGHCKKITPQIAKIAEYYLSKKYNVKFYTVEINGTREEFKKKMAEYGLTREGVINTADPTRQTGFDKKYDILSTPRTFVLDKDKKIIAKYISPKQCDEILNHYINGKDEPLVIFEEEPEHDAEHPEGEKKEEPKK